MTDSLVNLLRKTFIDGDPKIQVASTLEPTLRSSQVSNTVFEHTCKWLTEEELETQCVDWVFHYLLSKDFPESSAIRVTLEVRDCIFLDLESMAKLKGTQKDGDKRILTEDFENHVLAALTKIATIWYKNFQLVHISTESSSDKDTEKMHGFSVHAVKNTRRKMEDKHVTMPYFSELFKLKGTYSFYAVFDGHGGVEAAKYSSAHMPGLLGRYLRETEAQLANSPSRNSKVQTLMPPEAKPEVQRAPSPDLRQKKESNSLAIPSLLGQHVLRRSSGSLCSPETIDSPKITLQRNSYHGRDFRAVVESSQEQPGVVFVASRMAESNVKRVEEALEWSFLETDRMFCERVKSDNNGSGCTALCLLVEDGKRFYLSWAGDSQAVLVRDGKAIEIMKPHKPEREDEKARIEALGGSVVHFGTWRVNGAISVSRAIGDTGYKPYITSQPDTASFALQSGDEYIVLACDGLWDVLSYDDVIRLVTDHVTVKKKEKQTVAQMLVKAAVDNGSSDNITTLIVFLGKDLPTISFENSSLTDEKYHDENSDSSSSSGDREDNKQNLEKPLGYGTRSETTHCSGSHRNSRTETSMLSLSRNNKFDLPESENEGIGAINKAFQTSSNTVEAFTLEPSAFEGVQMDSDKFGDQTGKADHGNYAKLRLPQRHEESPKAPSELTGNSSSTNDDSKRNYFASSAELTLDLEFSPLRSEQKGQQDTGSAISLRSRVKRSPKISSSTESKEDKENIGLGLSPCLKLMMGESSLRLRSSDALEEQKFATDSSKMKLKETNAVIKEQSQNHVRIFKGLSKAASPEEKDVRLLFQVPPLNRELNQQRQQQRSTAGNFYSSQKQLQIYPKRNPFVSTSAVSVGLLKEGGRKFSHTGSHLRKLDRTKSRSNVGSSSSVNDSIISGRLGVREKWTIAVETGEDLEDMFETAGEDSANLNVSSTRW